MRFPKQPLNQAQLINYFLTILSRLTSFLLLLCLICPQTKKVFKAPVVAVDGETYEEDWLKTRLRSFNNILPGGRRQDRVTYLNAVVDELINKMKYGVEQASTIRQSPEASPSIVGFFAGASSSSSLNPNESPAIRR